MDKVEGAQPQPEDRPAAKASARSRQMAKSIVLFSDGTGNSSAALFKTNVWRLYEAADLGPGATGEQRQIGFYDNGVGTSALRPLAALFGVFGAGLKRNVLEIYRYACRNYDPGSVPLAGSGIADPGDHIYGFGFSRGAFTMRLVIGMIADQGLVPFTTEAALEKKSKLAYKEFRRHRQPRYWGEPSKKAKDRVVARLRAKGYDSSENHRPVIRFIGVWDTVAAYGGPVTEITRAIDNWLYRLTMPNYQLNPRVRCARHALALDDARDAFQPLLWDEFSERTDCKLPDGSPAPWLDGDRLKQVWFTGMHADVGGGYPDESLSYVSLLWMIDEANGHGLRTLDNITRRYKELANSYGPLHDSRSGPGAYYRYQPRRVAAWAAPADSKTLSLRADDDEAAAGLFGEALIHESVIARVASGTDGYAPFVLPPRYRIVPPGESTETDIEDTSGGDPPRPAAKKEPGPARLLPAHVQAWLDDGVKQKVADAMEPAWDKVWERRIVYFLTLAATLTLILSPWWLKTLEAEAGVAGIASPLAWLGGILGTAIGWVGAVLPSLAERWIHLWAAHPFAFALMAVTIWLLMRRGVRLERATADHARIVWRSAVPRIPPATASTGPTPVQAGRPSGLAGLRNHGAYQRTIHALKWKVLPNLIFPVLPLAALLVWLA
jgi:uncharacterized protein (DUF2235 family)